MHSTEVTKFDGLDSIKLIHQSSKSFISIIPAFGGLVNEWFDGPKDIQIFENYVDRKTLEAEHNLSFRGFRLVPYPNRVAGGTYRFNGSDYQLELGKIGEPNSIHGFAAKLDMSLTREQSSTHECQVELNCEYDGSEPGYPFEFQYSLTFTFRNGNELEVLTRVENTGSTTLPFGDGWHPYFDLDQDVEDMQLQFQSTGILELGEYGIPTGKVLDYDRFNKLRKINGEKLDDCFLLSDGVVVLEDDKHDLTIEMWQEMGGSKYNFLQVYTPRHRKSIAIEPVTCEPNAFNTGNGLIQIKPTEKIELRHGLRLI